MNTVESTGYLVQKERLLSQIEVAQDNDTVGLNLLKTLQIVQQLEFHHLMHLHREL